MRLALQELGPVWIKFGQMMSTRRDLFPPHIADQLALLQDQVVAGLTVSWLRRNMEKALGWPIEITGLMTLTLKPLASASIAQVHTAQAQRVRAVR